MRINSKEAGWQTGNRRLMITWVRDGGGWDQGESSGMERRQMVKICFRPRTDGLMD